MAEGLSGNDLRFAAKRAATWGTAVQCATGDGFTAMPGTFRKSYDKKTNKELGKGGPTTSARGKSKVEGDRPTYLKYLGIEPDLLIGMFMGSCGVTMTSPSYSGTATSGTTTSLDKTGAGWTIDALIGKWVTITAGTNIGVTRKITDNDTDTITFAAMPSACNATTVYAISNSLAAKRYQFADNLSGLFFTEAKREGSLNVEEIATVKLSGLTINGSIDDNFIEMSLKKLGSDVANNTSSGTNNLTTFTDVLVTIPSSRILAYEDLVIRMNDRDSGALDSGDVIYPSSFEITMDRPMRLVYGHGGSFVIAAEPSSNGIPTLGLKMAFDISDATTMAYMTECDLGTYKKLDFTFTEPGATGQKIVVSIPSASYNDAGKDETDGLIPTNVDFELLWPTAAPTGMTGVTGPVMIDVTNTNCGNPLQAGN